MLSLGCGLSINIGKLSIIILMIAIKILMPTVINVGMSHVRYASGSTFQRTKA